VTTDDKFDAYFETSQHKMRDYAFLTTSVRLSFIKLDLVFSATAFTCDNILQGPPDTSPEGC
jgi:hypothetical protein